MSGIIITVVLTLALLFAGVVIPFVGILGFVICALPLAVFACVEGHQRAAISEAIIEAILLIFISPSLAVYFFMSSAPLAGAIYILSESRYKKFTPSENVLICITTSIITKLFFLLAYKFFTGQNFLIPNYDDLALVLNQLYPNSKEAEALFNYILEIYPKLIPSVIIFASGLEGLLVYTLTSRIIKKYFQSAQVKPEPLKKFEDWKFTYSTILTLFIARIIGHFINADEYPELYYFLLNLQFLGDIILFTAGLSLTAWFLARHGLKNITARNFILAIIILIPLSWPVLILLGVADMCFTIRKQ